MRISRLAAAAAALALAVAAAPGYAQDPKQPVTTLKAAEQNSDIDIYKWEGDRAPIPRDFVQQLPLIPHSTRATRSPRTSTSAWTATPGRGRPRAARRR